MSRYKTCRTTKKARYTSHTRALLALVEIVFDLEGQQPQREKVPCRTYSCPHCGGWHLTSLPWEKSIDYLRSTANRVDSTRVLPTPQFTE